MKKRFLVFMLLIFGVFFAIFRADTAEAKSGGHATFSPNQSIVDAYNQIGMAEFGVSSAEAGITAAQTLPYDEVVSLSRSAAIKQVALSYQLLAGTMGSFYAMDIETQAFIVMQGESCAKTCYGNNVDQFYFAALTPIYGYDSASRSHWNDLWSRKEVFDFASMSPNGLHLPAGVTMASIPPWPDHALKYLNGGGTAAQPATPATLAQPAQPAAPAATTEKPATTDKKAAEKAKLEEEQRLKEEAEKRAEEERLAKEAEAKKKAAEKAATDKKAAAEKATKDAEEKAAAELALAEQTLAEVEAASNALLTEAKGLVASVDLQAAMEKIDVELLKANAITNAELKTQAITAAEQVKTQMQTLLDAALNTERLAARPWYVKLRDWFIGLFNKDYEP